MLCVSVEEVCVSLFQVDKLQQANAERAEEQQDQQPSSMISTYVIFISRLPGYK